MPEELVVLVNEKNKQIGTMPKAEVHGKETPLHRAFSAFIFRQSDGQFLLQQRSKHKKTWPLVWSNSCCGHPGPGESTLDAAKRRLKHELGLKPLWLTEALPYRYCFTRDGVMENEICPIVVGMVDREPEPNSDEVEAVRWTTWHDFLAELEKNEAGYSEWCVEEARLLEKSGLLREIVFQRVGAHNADWKHE